MRLYSDGQQHEQKKTCRLLATESSHESEFHNAITLAVVGCIAKGYSNSKAVGRIYCRVRSCVALANPLC